jgi:hypothetical protein
VSKVSPRLRAYRHSLRALLPFAEKMIAQQLHAANPATTFCFDAERLFAPDPCCTSLSSIMRAIKQAAIVIVAFAIIDGIVWLTRFGDICDIADEGPDAMQAVNLLAHWPGLMTAQLMRLSGPACFAVVEAVTLVQMFLAAWIVIAIWRGLYGRRVG